MIRPHHLYLAVSRGTAIHTGRDCLLINKLRKDLTETDIGCFKSFFISFKAVFSLSHFNSPHISPFKHVRQTHVRKEVGKAHTDLEQRMDQKTSECLSSPVTP